MKRNCNYQEAPRSRLIYEFYFCHRYLQSRSYNDKITADRIVGALRTKAFVCTTLLSGEVTVQEKRAMLHPGSQRGKGYHRTGFDWLVGSEMEIRIQEDIIA